jgi:hypothetical protein
MASVSVLESLLARVRQRAAEPRPARPASRMAMHSYADVEDDDIEEYEDELVEIVDEPAPVLVRQSPVPAGPVTQRSEPPPPPPPPAPRLPPTWDVVAARAKRSLRPPESTQPRRPESAFPQPVTQQSPAVSAAAIVARSPLVANGRVAESRGKLPPADGESFADLLEHSLELGA